MNKRPRVLILVDYFDVRWRQTYDHVEAGFREEGFEVDRWSLGGFQFPSKDRSGGLLAPRGAKNKGGTDSSLDYDCPRSDCEGLDESLWRSELISVLRDESVTGRTYRWLKNKKQLLGHSFYHHLQNTLHQADFDLVCISNGRLGLQQIASLVCKNMKIPTKYLESWILNLGTFDRRVFSQDYPPHNRLLAQKHMIGSNYTYSVPIAKRWVEQRGQNNKAVNQFSGKWSSKDQMSNISMTTNAFFSSSTDEYAALGPEWKNSEWADQYDSFIKIVSRLKLMGEKNFVLRMHPNLLNKHPRQYLREISRVKELARMHPEVQIISPSSRINSYMLVREANRIFVSLSTIGLEASILGKPVWCTQDNRYDMVADVRTIHGVADLKKDDLQGWRINTAAGAKFLFGLVAISRPIGSHDGRGDERHTLRDTISGFSSRHLVAKFYLSTYRFLCALGTKFTHQYHKVFASVYDK